VKVVWTPEAEQDRAAIWDQLRSRNPGAALRMDRLFSLAAARLAEYPLAGRLGRIAGTREVSPHRNYRIVSEIVDQTVWILVLIHAARPWPPVRE
jgi:addiction module RelE/StbE family toxin